jgi:Flp pilus assembly protein CpaB
VAIPSNKPQNRILLVGGIIFALLAAGVVYIAVSKSGTSAGNASATVPVVVARQNIPAGTLITTADVGVDQYPIGTQPLSFYSTTTQVVNQTASQAITRGSAITQSMLGTPNPAAGIPLSTNAVSPFLIADGYAALAIPSHLSTPNTTVDQMSVGYYIQPGDQIDILAQVPVSSSATQVSFGYLFQDIPVLAVAAVAPSGSPAATTANQPPAYYVVEMPQAEAVEMTAILTGNYATVSGGTTGMVLKYVLRPGDEYGSWSKVSTDPKTGVTSVTFNPVTLPNVPTVSLPSSPVT